jgi:hypothetical protein
VVRAEVLGAKVQRNYQRYHPIWSWNISDPPIFD